MRDENSHSITPLVNPGGTVLSACEKAEALADSLGSQFQPVTARSFPAVIENANEQVQSYLRTPASEPTSNRI